MRVCVSFAKVERIMSEFEDFFPLKCVKCVKSVKLVKVRKFSLLTPF